MLHDFAVGGGLGLLGVAETWLSAGVPDSFVDLGGYSVVRCDSTSGVRKHGVCMYIRKDIKFRCIDVGCENVCGAHLVDFDLFVAVVYRPPSNGPDENAAICSFLHRFCDSREVIVLGDFNLPSVPWGDLDALSLRVPPLQRVFIDCFQSLGLTQWVVSPTFVPSLNILDLVLSSERDRLGDVTVHPAFPGCGHCPVTFGYYFRDSVVVESSGCVRRAWHRGNYELIERVLSDVDWDFEFFGLSVDEMVSRFNSILSSLVSLYVPIFVPRPHRARFRPPRQLITSRQSSWLNYKDVRSRYGRRSREAADALSSYQDINAAYRSFYSRSLITYELSLAANFAANSKLFHRYIRSKKVGNPSVGPLKSGNNLISDCSSMAEVLADSFSSVYSVHVPQDPAPHQAGAAGGITMDRVQVSVDSVRSVFSSIDVNSCMGPDDIHPCLLKYCQSLVLPMHRIFVRSLEEGVVPSQWKFSEIVPLFKKGSRSDPMNYRPISLTSVCCKSLERIIASALMDFLEENSLLSLDQFGFRRGRTVEDQLLLVYNDVSAWLDSHYAVDVVLFDFSKAFDVVPHSVLIAKLSKLGISGCLLRWIADFLSGRRMCVGVAGARSSDRPVLSGVPQGSVLGPLLFIVFVNHLPSFLHNNCKLFADDMKIYLRLGGRGVEDLSSCQRDIDELHRVAVSWGLKFNVAKCVTMRFSRGAANLSTLGSLSVYNMAGSDILLQESSRDLGVLVDSSLKFHAHIRQVVGKAWGLANNLLRSTLCRSREFMCNLFITHIRPLLEFASPVWNTGYVGDSVLLESVQRRWTKHIDGLGDVEYGDRLRGLGLYSVKGRLLRADLIKYYKIFNGLSVISPAELFVLSPTAQTRGHRFKVLKPHVSLESRRRYFSVRCLDVWNSLPDDLVACGSVASFKSGLHVVLGDILFRFDG